MEIVAPVAWALILIIIGMVFGRIDRIISLIIAGVVKFFRKLF